MAETHNTAHGRPEDRFSSGIYWIFATIITFVAVTVVGYMVKTTGINVQHGPAITMPMTDNSGQKPATN